MQRYKLSKKNVITVISGLLIALGFYSHLVLENVGLSEWSYANCHSSVSSNESQSHQY